MNSVTIGIISYHKLGLYNGEFKQCHFHSRIYLYTSSARAREFVRGGATREHISSAYALRAVLIFSNNHNFLSTIWVVWYLTLLNFVDRGVVNIKRCSFLDLSNYTEIIVNRSIIFIRLPFTTFIAHAPL